MSGPLDRLRRLLKPKGSLTRLSITSGVWMAGTKIGTRGFQTVMVIVLAGLLTPAQFGIAGVAFVVTSALNRFSQLGLNAALIQNADDNVDRYLNTSWMLGLGRGIVLAGALVAIAPFAASFFSMPTLAAILPVMAIGPLAIALKNPGMVYLTKDLQYHKRFVHEVSASGLQLVVAVGYALYDPTVWALVFGFLTTSVSKAALSYWIHDYRPWFGFDLELAKELVDYGKWMNASNIISFIQTEGDDLFVGWLLAPAALGFYQMSYRLGNAPATEITHVVSDVSFPAYSKIQDDAAALRKGLARSVQAAMFVSAPLAIGIAVVTPTFVRAAFGPEWLPMIVPMQILALFGLIHAYGAAFGSVWKAVGRPDLNVKIGLVTLTSIAIAIWPLTEMYGIVGTAAVILGSELLVATPIATLVTLRLIDMDLTTLLRASLYPTVAGALMGAVVYAVQELVVLQSPVLELGLLVVVGGVAYAAAVAVLETQFNWGLRAQFRQIRRAI